jgi:YcxB-like protein
MSYSFTLSKLEHWRASRAVQQRTLMYKLAWALFGGAPIVIVASAVIGGANAWEYILSNPIGVFGGPFLLLVGFPLLQYWSVWMYHRNLPTLKGSQVFEFTPDRLIMRGPMHNTELDWRAVRRVVETDRFMLFFVSKSVAYFLPKRAIPHTDLPHVRDQLAQWLPGRVALHTERRAVAAA